jgi:hypothetical protein
MTHYRLLCLLAINLAALEIEQPSTFCLREGPPQRSSRRNSVLVTYRSTNRNRRRGGDTGRELHDIPAEWYVL